MVTETRSPTDSPSKRSLKPGNAILANAKSYTLAVLGVEGPFVLGAENIDHHDVVGLSGTWLADRRLLADRIGEPPQPSLDLVVIHLSHEPLQAIAA